MYTLVEIVESFYSKSLTDSGSSRLTRRLYYMYPELKRLLIDCDLARATDFESAIYFNTKDGSSRSTIAFLVANTVEFRFKESGRAEGSWSCPARQDLFGRRHESPTDP